MVYTMIKLRNKITKIFTTSVLCLSMLFSGNIEASKFGQVIIKGGTSNNLAEVDSNNQLHVINSDSSGNAGVSLIDPNDGTRAGEFDSLVKAPIFIDIGHHELHEGASFIVCNPDTSMASADTMVFAFKTPAGIKRVHMLISYATLSGGHLELIEGPTWTNQSGSLKPIYNRKREASMSSSVLLEDSGQAAFTATDNIILNPTGLAGGTLIHCRYTFGSKNIGPGADRGTNETILKPDTQYAVMLTSDVASNKGYMELNWYEHTDE